MHHRHTLLAAAILFAAGTSAVPLASTAPGPLPTMDILVDGHRRPAYPARGTLYIEALKGREYRSACATPILSGWPSRFRWTG